MCGSLLAVVYSLHGRRSVFFESWLSGFVEMSNESISSNVKDIVKIYGNYSLHERISNFQKRADNQLQQQRKNPFSNKDVLRNDTLSQFEILGISKNDPRYGRPPEGSNTEFRGVKAEKHINKEIEELCSLIREYGCTQADGSVLIEFGELFQMYTVISNKVVGLLLRARKHGLVDFPGEMLYQRRDDHVVITLNPQDE